ncbi:MAG: tyrosine-protein kinase Etk/Wzc [Sphingomonadales bacterium]|nr:tyrosine-protein kinase Etk/Wzc [Sphingomonadales bacterium]
MSGPIAAMPVGRPDYADDRADSVSLAQIWDALKRHRRWIVIPTVLAFIGSLLFVNLVSPRYTGEAKVLLEVRESFYTRPGQERVDQPQIDEQAVASQVQVVLSRDLGREAVRRLRLVGNPEFDPLVNGIGPVRRLMILLGLARNPYDFPPEERVLDSFYDRLLVYTIGKSRVLAIEFRSRDPDLAALGANTVADLYLALQEAAKKDTARSASIWLGPAIDQLRGRVADAEAKVEAFRARNGLFIGGTNASISAQQLSDLNAQLAQARSAQADAQAKARLIRDMIRSRQTIEIPDVANNELIRRLTEQSVNLRTQLALEARTLLPQHPRMKELNAQLTDLEAQIRTAAERTVRTLENEARLAGSRVETLQAAVDAQKQVAATANESEVQLRALEREARAEREQLESYLTRYREAVTRDVANATPPDARIVSRAAVPQAPSFPKKLPTIVLVTLATLILALGTVVGRELLGVRGFEVAGRWPPARAGEAQQRLMSVAGRAASPAQGSAPGAAAASAALATESERYNFEGLIARLSKAKAEDRGRRVLITSVEKAVDATDMAKGLGRMLSRNGRAILVSLDRGPGEAAGEPGLTDLVGGDASFSDIIERVSGLRLHTVPIGTLDVAVLHKDQSALDLALSAFDQTYDWVLCVLRHSREEALLSLFAPKVDAVVIASNADPASGSLVDLYERAKKAGAPDVVVAREQAPASASVEMA